MSETALLLTPYHQTELGLVFYRIPPNVPPSAVGERTVLMAAGAALATQPSGQIATPNTQTVRHCAYLAGFAKLARVRLVAGGEEALAQWLGTMPTCQCRDGVYCHKEMTLTKVDQGLVRTCWHHDNQAHKQLIATKTLADLAERNWVAFLAHVILRDLKRAAGGAVEFADIALWAARKNIADLLDDTALRKWLDYAPQVDLNKASSAGFETYPHRDFKQLAKPILALKVDPEPLASFMARPKLKRFECAKWLQFVKAQPCVCCGQRADDPHHLIGVGGGAMGSKAHDLFVIPLCRQHHNALHRDLAAFEQQYGTQQALLYQFLDRAIGLGALVIDG